MIVSLDGSQSPPWANRWNWAAGIYNLAWGALAIAWPNLLFDLTGAERINYPEIWQYVGMIVGVYGIRYIIAASDSRTHWPIVVVGLLGNSCRRTLLPNRRRSPAHERVRDQTGGHSQGGEVEPPPEPGP